MYLKMFLAWWLLHRRLSAVCLLQSLFVPGAKNFCLNLVPNKEDVKSAFQLAKIYGPFLATVQKRAVKQRQCCGEYLDQFSGTDRFGGSLVLTTTHSTVVRVFCQQTL